MKIVSQVKPDEAHKEDVESLVYYDAHLFSGGYDGTIKKWTPNLELVTEWKAHEYPTYSLATNGSGSIFSSSSDGEVKEWNANNGEFKQMTVIINPINEQTTDVKALVFNNGHLYTGDMCGNLCRFEPNFRKDKEKYTYTEIWSLAVSPSGDRIFTARDNTIIVSDMAVDVQSDACQEENARRVRQFRPMPFFSAINFKREEFQPSLEVLASIEGRAPVIASDAHVVCTDRNGMKIKVFENSIKFPLLATLEGHEMIVNALAQDDHRVVSSGWDGLVKMWDKTTGAETGQVKAEGYVDAMTWSKDEPDTIFVSGKGGMILKIHCK